MTTYRPDYSGYRFRVNSGEVNGNVLISNNETEDARSEPERISEAAPFNSRQVGEINIELVISMMLNRKTTDGEIKDLLIKAFENNSSLYARCFQIAVGDAPITLAQIAKQAGRNDLNSWICNKEQGHVAKEQALRDLTEILHVKAQ